MTIFSEFLPNSDLDPNSIKKLGAMGFRRWYERQLIESHLWLTMCICCMVAFAAGLELLGERRGQGDFLINALIVVGGAVVGWLAWRKYACTMIKAESVGLQAICGACKHYGFRVIADQPAPAADRSAYVDKRLKVRCPKCSNQWDLNG